MPVQMKTQRFVRSSSGVCAPGGEREGRQPSAPSCWGGAPRQLPQDSWGCLVFALLAWERIQQLVGAD